MSFTDFLLSRLNKDKVLDYLSDVVSGDDKALHLNMDDEITYRVKENYQWYKGSAASLAKFYKENKDPQAFNGYSENNFWRWSNSADSKVQKVHIPVASQISQAMTTLVFDDFPRWDVDSGNKDTSKPLNQIVQKTFKDNDFTRMCQEGAQLESYSGALACKFTIDPKFSQTPILEFYPFGDFEISEKYGKVYEIIFKDHYRYKDSDYVLNSIYGRGYIRYKLIRISNNKQILADLTELPETSELKDILFVDEKGNPIPILMAAYKVNRACNNDKPGSTLGSSDYAGLANIFDSIDCIASMRQNYFRYGARIPITISEDNIAIDKNGNTITNLDELDILVLKDSNPADTQQFRETKVPTLSNAAFAEAIANLIGYCCDRCGLSRTSFGVEQAGRNASAESLSIRQEASYRTRQAKIKLWSRFIEDIMELSLIYNTAIVSATEKEGKNLVTIPSSILSYSYIVEFPPFEQESDLERAERIKTIESTGYITREDALKMYYDPIMEPKQLDIKVKELLSK